MGAFHGVTSTGPRNRIGQRLRLLLAPLTVVLVFAGFAAQARAATYSVGTTADTTGTCANPAGGQCSLRQLINYENALPSTPNPPDTIVVPAGGYGLTSGALTISRAVSIVGAGAGTTTVEQASNTPDRVFDVQATAAPVTISGLSIEFGTADSNNGFFGGDVRNAGTLTLSNDWITSGTTDSGSGAGISNDAGTLTVINSLVSGNTSTNSPGGGGDSGGIQNFGNSTTPGRLTVANSTVSNNTSDQQGGGVFSWCNSGSCPPGGNTVTITNSTIAYNQAAASSGGLLVGPGAGTMTVQNSIVASNTLAGTTPTPSNCGSSGIASLGYNIESGTDCGFKTTGDHQNTNPMLTSTSPEGWGGNTATFALDARSPAVDAIPPGMSGCTGADQRAVNRPQGQGCDIGAFELFQPVAGQQAQIQVDAGGCSFTGVASINWGDGTPPSNSNPDTFVGTHTYAKPGIYDGSVTYTDDCGTHTDPFDVKVQSPVVASGNAIAATSGKPFSGPVATFTDATPGRAPSDFSATINWGDGSSSAGTITGSAGSFTVDGTHTYSSPPGTYTTTISISDVGGATATTNGSATVSTPPSATTGKPSITSSGATFSAMVNPEGSPTTALWRYGVDPSDRGPGFSGNPLNQSTASQSVGSGFASRSISGTAANLLPDTVYDVQVVASNGGGTTFGPIQKFATPPSSPPAVPPPGKENFKPTGRIFVLVNGQFVKLTQTLTLPSGTIVDALGGSITLVSSSLGAAPATDAKAGNGAKPKKSKTFTGTFSGGVFKVTQTRSGPNKGLTTLTLVDSTPAFKGAPSYATTCKAHGGAGDPVASAAHIYRIYSVSGRARGRYSTRGRYGAGTVRGTDWTVTDRCDGTLISVQTHSVLVSDFVKHKTFVVTAGHHYLARRPK